MILLNLGGKKRIHAMNWTKRLTKEDGGGSLVKARRSTPMRQMFWKVKSQWRLALRSRSSVRFGYDPESYSQNFDDGSLPQ
ncbi:hypothetical protein COCNU_07G001240 [Cocos nucifera]|uniref:Uncharacterized protein n=1 Tax=Cocos nucifera TaxID=13894 RepID=A0A8K0IE43_COCNU|nr:hypothetical protein COCNU_07G001240 [Cocos nucifera]